MGTNMILPLGVHAQHVIVFKSMRDANGLNQNVRRKVSGKRVCLAVDSCLRRKRLPSFTEQYFVQDHLRQEY